MKKYKIIFIICFLIVLGLLIYILAPQVKNVGTFFYEKTDGNRKISQEQLRATKVGELYISDEVREHNKNVQHIEFEIGENYDGDVDDGTFSKVISDEEANRILIYGGNGVAKFFANSSNYYNAEVKMEEAFNNYIPELLSVTVNMTNTELRSYFENNIDIIEKRFGIVSANAFVKFIGGLDKLSGKKYKEINIPGNSVTENYTNLSINFLVELTLEDGSKVAPVSITVSHLKSTPNQMAPYIQFVGLYKSQRPE